MAVRVVLAEDEEDIGFIVKTKLEGAGFEVTWKKNGLEAWNAISADLPALAILDVDMPGMDGLEVLKRIKESPDTRAIPVIMLTAQGHEAYVATAKERGANEFVMKPFRPADVLDRVQRLVAARPAGR